MRPNHNKSQKNQANQAKIQRILNGIRCDIDGFVFFD
jgi:hypothetical protein